MLGPSMMLIGTPIALTYSARSAKTAPCQAIVAVALGLSLIEAVGVTAMCLLLLLS